jgi:YVTN family beta-propeller protein
MTRTDSPAYPVTVTRVAWALAGSLATLGGAMAAGSYQIYVSDERSNDVTVIDGGDFSVVSTIPVGKRPRGIHASPDGKFVYVAMSGTPIAAPPQLDAHGNPIFKRGGDDDDNDSESEARSSPDRTPRNSRSARTEPRSTYPTRTRNRPAWSTSPPPRSSTSFP